jgi:hypothetical protein
MCCNPKGKKLFKCTWKGNGPELFIFITSNKNKQKSNKNLEIMIGATKAQLLR